MTRRYPNGETYRKVSYSQFITIGSEPGELKHLSNLRKKKENSIPKVAASEQGRAQSVKRENS